MKKYGIYRFYPPRPQTEATPATKPRGATGPKTDPSSSARLFSSAAAEKQQNQKERSEKRSFPGAGAYLNFLQKHEAHRKRVGVVRDSPRNSR